MHGSALRRRKLDARGALSTPDLLILRRRVSAVSKDGRKLSGFETRSSWFETAQERLLTMRPVSHQAAIAFSADAAEA
jgi:hypothetical protein